MSNKIAIVYDWIDKWGGAERVLLNLHHLFPDAHFYTSYTDVETAGWAKDLPIKTSFMQYFPTFVKKNRGLSFAFFPHAFESFDFSPYEVVISITSSFAKGIITKPQTKHICYLLTPTRFLWSNSELYLRQSILTSSAYWFAQKLRKWDFCAAQRPDEMLSISKTVSARCMKYYRRRSQVVYPPFDSGYWANVKKDLLLKQGQLTQNNKKFFLVISRLEPYKRVDIVVHAFNKLSNLSLVIVGKGSLKKALQQRADKNISFKETLSDRELAWLYQNAEALIMPQEEDFGYVALEGQFFGCPIISYNKGAAAETVVEGKTGLFFKGGVPGLVACIARFQQIFYNIKQTTVQYGPKHIMKFSADIFEERISKLINN